jgi:hypothetical protein
LLRTTLAQAGAVRDAIERGAREGRSRLDDARANRRRNDALAELGEIVLELIRDGEIDLAELPEARDVVSRIDELDARDDEPAPRDEPRSASRRRFDDRASARDRDDDGTVSSRAAPIAPRGGAAPRVWRPVEPRASEEPSPRRTPKPRQGGIRFDDDDDLASYMHPDDVPPKEPPDGDA